MIKDGERYFIIGHIKNPPEPVNEVKIRANDNGHVTVANDPIPPEQENYAIFVAKKGSQENRYSFKSLQLNTFLQPKEVGAVDEIAAVEPPVVELFCSEIPGEPNTYWVSMGPEATSDHLTAQNLAPGSDVEFMHKATSNEQSKQKWKFMRDTDLVKPTKKRPRRSLLGYILGKKG